MADFPHSQSISQGGLWPTCPICGWGSQKSLCDVDPDSPGADSIRRLDLHLRTGAKKNLMRDMACTTTNPSDLVVFQHFMEIGHRGCSSNRQLLKASFHGFRLHHESCSINGKATYVRWRREKNPKIFPTDLLCIYYIYLIQYITSLSSFSVTIAFAKSDANETNPSDRKQCWISYLRSKHSYQILHLGTWGMIDKNVVLRSLEAINLCATATLLHITPNMSQRTFM